MSQQSKRQVVATLQTAVEEVFLVPLKTATAHAFMTFTLFNIFVLEFPFFATSLSFIFSIVPIVPSYLVTIPWVIGLCFAGQW